MLTTAQSDAIMFVSKAAKKRQASALSTINHILEMSNIPRSTFDGLLAALKTKMRVAFHFHPDRLDPNGRTVAEALLDCGIYKSQFETLLSSGSIVSRFRDRKKLRGVK